jgi:hypothetical protein
VEARPLGGPLDNDDFERETHREIAELKTRTRIREVEAGRGGTTEVATESTPSSRENEDKTRMALKFKCKHKHTELSPQFLHFTTVGMLNT